MKTQAGFALIEAIVVIAIVSLGVGVLMLALSSAAKSVARADGRNHAAATLFAEQTLRVAQNAWKYGSPGDAPSGSLQTTISVAAPGATPATIPAAVTSTISPESASGATMTLTVDYPPDPGHPDPGTVTLSGSLRALAPLPGSQVLSPGLVPLPGSR